MNIYIIADIEGSTGCRCPDDARLFTFGWAKACVELTKDINKIASELYKTGKVNCVKVKDFHRTGFNILPSLIDKSIKLDQGYKAFPIPGIGKLKGFDALMMIGMHAASGSDGFIAHTLTSRFKKIVTNGTLLTEAELFASSVAQAGLKPIFFSGCPVACEQTSKKINNIHTHAITNKSNPEAQRKMLAISAAKALNNTSVLPHTPEGPFYTELELKCSPEKTRQIAKKWNLESKDNKIIIQTCTIAELYRTLINIAYLTPFISKSPEIFTRAFAIFGRFSQLWPSLLS